MVDHARRAKQRAIKRTATMNESRILQRDSLAFMTTDAPRFTVFGADEAFRNATPRKQRWTRHSFGATMKLARIAWWNVGDRRAIRASEKARMRVLARMRQRILLRDEADYESVIVEPFRVHTPRKRKAIAPNKRYALVNGKWRAMNADDYERWMQRQRDAETNATLRQDILASTSQDVRQQH